MVVLSLRNYLVTFSSNQHHGSDQDNDQGDCRKDHHGKETRIPLTFFGSGVVAGGLDFFFFRSRKFACWIHGIGHAGLDAGSGLGVVWLIGARHGRDGTSDRESRHLALYFGGG